MTQNMSTPKKRSAFLLVDTPNKSLVSPNNISKSDFLGRGTYGTVYKGSYKGKLVAVKFLPKSYSDEMPKTLLNEANILSLNHKNVIKLLEITSNERYGMVIMENLGNKVENLQLAIDSLSFKKLSISLYFRLRIILDIFNGLSYCHKQNILHLDVKPQNILLIFEDFPVENFYCKLCDFGSSINMSNLNPNSDHLYKGTIRYMAPEMLKGEIITEKTDIFSMGITMWQLKSMLKPYQTINSNEVVAYNVVKYGIRPDDVTSTISEIQKISSKKLFSKSNKIQSRGRKQKTKQISRTIMCLPEIQSNFSKNEFTSYNKNSLRRRTLFCPAISEICVTFEGEEKENELISLTTKTAQKSKLLIIEEEYEKLYKLLWQTDPELRPTSITAIENITNLLSYLK
uniref:non-specific serine/threonine protein kinase n=1 Tax=Culicoides sonorensis TaxID=179676 RepID=A0A336LY75_CULSO